MDPYRPTGYEPLDTLKPVAEGLWLIRSPLTRSKLYHRIKWQLPEGTALLCAPLGDDPDGWPKFKGMDAGALAWLRRD